MTEGRKIRTPGLLVLASLFGVALSNPMSGYDRVVEADLPKTDADLKRIAAAQAKRERKAARKNKPC